MSIRGIAAALSFCLCGYCPEVSAQRASFIPVVQQEVREALGRAGEGSERIAGNFRMVVRGKELATVVLPQVRISDLADVSSSYPGDDELVIAIKNAVLGASPSIGEEATFTAAQVLDVVREVTRGNDQVGYIFPRVMKVVRAYRTIGVDEVTRALSSYLQASEREAKVLGVSLPRAEVRVPPRADIRDITPLASVKGSHFGQGPTSFQVKVQEQDKVVQTFNVQATVQEWGQLPVARRALARGDVVGASDVTLARVNLSTASGGIAQSVDEIIGQKLSQDVSEGALFRTQLMVTPPMVRVGESVTLLYRSKLLEASASATALESGVFGAQVRVRNETSKRVMQGTISGPGIVEVRQ